MATIPPGKVEIRTVFSLHNNTNVGIRNLRAQTVKMVFFTKAMTFIQTVMETVRY